MYTYVYIYIYGMYKESLPPPEKIFFRFFSIFFRFFRRETGIGRPRVPWAHFSHFLRIFRFSQICAFLRISAHFWGFWGKFSAFFDMSRGQKKFWGKFFESKFDKTKKKLMKIIENFKIGQNIKVLHIKILQIFWNVQISYFHCNLDMHCQDKFSTLWKILSRFHISAFFCAFLALFFCAFFRVRPAHFPPPGFVFPRTRAKTGIAIASLANWRGRVRVTT